MQGHLEIFKSGAVHEARVPFGLALDAMLHGPHDSRMALLSL